MDDPRHATLRKLVAEGFKPRAVKRIEDGIRADARTIVDDLGDEFEGDFVEAVAKRLPMMTIMRMLGVPEEDQEAVLWGVDAAVSWNDPEFLGGPHAARGRGRVDADHERDRVPTLRGAAQANPPTT